MPSYRYTDPETGKSWNSSERLTPDELDEVFGAPARSASDPTGQIQGIDLRKGAATSVRVLGGLGGAAVGGAIGTAIEPGGGTLVGARVGGGVGSGLAEIGAEKIEGRPVNPKEVLAQTAIGGLAPGVNTPVKALAYGAGSVTLDSLARGEGLPSVGQTALGMTFALAGERAVSRLTMRSSLREVLPKDVADETHLMLTEGKTTAPGLHDELREMKTAQAQQRFPFSPRPAPEIDVSEVSDVQTPKYSKQVKGRFVRLTSSQTPQELPGILGPRYGGKARVATEAFEPALGPYPREPEPEDMRGIADWVAMSRGAGMREPPANVRWYTAGFKPIGRMGRLFDDMQTQTRLPLYDDVYVPIKAAMGDKEKLAEEIKRITKTYVKDRNVHPIVKRTVSQFTLLAQSARDGTARDLAYSIQQFAKRFPIFGREISNETAVRWASTIITSPQISLLPFRAGPALRVFSHSVQTGYMLLGERWLARGLTRALTKEGMQEAMRLGALDAEAVPEEVADVMNRGGWYSKLVRYGFSGFRYAQDKSRAIMFWGQYERTLDAARRAGGDVGKFGHFANLDLGLPKAEAIQIGKLYQKGLIPEAARRAGIARADFGVPTHSRLDRPEIMTSSTLGKTTFGLFNWPNFYASTLKNTFVTSEAAMQKRALAASRWIVANTFLYHVAKHLYGDLQTKTAESRARELTFFGPALYEGSAAIESAQALVGGTKKIVSGEKGGFKQFARGLKLAVPLPIYAAEDLYAAGVKLKKTLEDR